MTIKELKDKLKKFPDNYEIIFHQSGAVWNTPIERVLITNYDKVHKLKKVTLTDY